MFHFAIRNSLASKSILPKWTVDWVMRKKKTYSFSRSLRAEKPQINKFGNIY